MLCVHGKGCQALLARRLQDWQQPGWDCRRCRTPRKRVMKSLRLATRASTADFWPSCSSRTMSAGVMPAAA